jgi:hypothetical protein
MKYHNKLNQLLSLLLLVLFSSSCEEVLKVKLPNNAPKITVNCILNVGDSVQMGITSSQSYPPLKDTSIIIKDAIVNLFENNIYVENLVYHEYYQNQNKINCYHSLKGIPLKTEHSYSIFISAPGFTEVAAKTTIPQTVPIISVDTNTVIINYDKYTEQALECNIKFKDPKGINNYYKIVLRRLGIYNEYDSLCHCFKTMYQEKSMHFFCYDLNAIYFRKSPNNPGSISLEKNDTEYWVNEVYLNDNTFDGLTYELKVLIPIPIQDLADMPGKNKGSFKSKIYFNLYSINEDYYKYAKSYFIQVYKKNDMFSEPSQVYSNIDKGFGIFSSSSSSIDSSIVMSVNYMKIIE